MSDVLNVVNVQMQSTDCLEGNLKQIHQVLDSYKPGDVDLFCFPENAFYFYFEGKDDFSMEWTMDLWQTLRDKSDELNSHFLFGTAPFAKKDKINPAMVLCQPGKPAHIVYEKIHLFRFEGDSYRHTLDESVRFIKGDKPEVIEINDWKIGLSICYDLRFSELYSFYSQQGVELIVVPSSFLVPTGKAHWEVLLRARAIETQSYVVAPAQGGEHLSKSGKTKSTYGHAMTVDPWGEVLQCGNGESISHHLVSLKKQKIAEVKAKIPMELSRSFLTQIRN